MLDDSQLLRYSRQILLPQIDIEGQNRLLGATALIVGLGGLGSPVAMYLAAAGVGQCILVDDDQVDLSNLQRQIIHSTESIGVDKVTSASERIAQLNPHCQVKTFNRRLNQSELTQLVDNCQVVLDCTDNFETRFLLNRLAYQFKTPLVSGAAIRWEGQLCTYTYAAGTPCYHCLYEEDSFNDQTCSRNGVIAPLVGIIGAMQALEAIKVLVNTGETMTGRLMIFDGLQMEWRQIKFKPRADCPVCSHG